MKKFLCLAGALSGALTLAAATRLGPFELEECGRIGVGGLSFGLAHFDSSWLRTAQNDASVTPGKVPAAVEGEFLLDGVFRVRGGEFQPGDYVSAVTTSSGQTLQTEGLQIYEDGYFLTNISANGTVNTAEPGCYQVEYTYRTSRSEGSAWLTVMVRE